LHEMRADHRIILAQERRQFARERLYARVRHTKIRRAQCCTVCRSFINTFAKMAMRQGG